MIIQLDWAARELMNYKGFGSKNDNVKRRIRLRRMKTMKERTMRRRFKMRKMLRMTLKGSGMTVSAVGDNDDVLK